jgi:uncharacterized membrane protein YqhA
MIKFRTKDIHYQDSPTAQNQSSTKKAELSLQSTRSMSQDTIMPVAKSVFCAAMLFVLAIFASAVFLLATLQMIYDFVTKREEDATTLAMKLCMLITIACLLFIFCEFFVERFNDGAN